MVKLAILLTAIPILSSNAQRGTWEGQFHADNVFLNIKMTKPNGFAFYTKSMPRSDLGDVVRSGNDVVFKLTRPAGTVSFRGDDAADTDGTWVFLPSSTFAQQLDKLGFSDLQDDRLFIIAMSDLTIADIRYLKQTKPDLTILKLVQLCNHGVTSDYVRALRRERNG